MEELIKRVETEKNELSERVKRLELFKSSEKYGRLSEQMRELLHRQYWCMRSYIQILESRLDLMEKEMVLGYTE